MGIADTILLTRPARKWDDGLPLGNGRLGMMVPGKVNEETIYINEETLWYGPARCRRNPDSREHIDEIRKLLLKGETGRAAFFAKMALTSTPKYNNPYQPAGDLRLCFQDHQGKATDYRRYLDLKLGEGFVEYGMGSNRYRREMFVSRRYQTAVIRLTVTGENPSMTLSANMSRKPFEENTGRLDEKTVANWGENGVGGVRYFTGVRMCSDAPVRTMGDFVYTENAKEIVIYVNSATDFMEDGSKNEAFREECLRRLDEAEKAGFEEIKKAHAADYGELYGTMDFTINGIGDSEGVRLSEECSGTKKDTAGQADTAAMLSALKEGDLRYLDELTVLLFRYARYLLISSSTDCRLPANLQGIWNGSYEPPWQSEFTININEQMNYWFAEKAGLSDCHLPLFRLLERLAENGKETAKEFYGCEGFVAHHNTNLWANTDMEGIFDASPFWVMGGAWLSLHLYEHFLYTQDKEFLKNRALPVMREAIRFFEGYLYEDESGMLLTGPVVSPENTYLSETGEKGALCMAPTMDTTILRQLITWYLEGQALCRDGKNGDDEGCGADSKNGGTGCGADSKNGGTGCGAEGGDRDNGCTAAEKDEEILRRIQGKLPPIQISRDGRIMEWYREYEETEPGHRHCSHLFGLHPGVEITRDRPELFEAARKTLDYRLSHGGGHTGWSKAWVTCFYARLRDGEKVGANVKELLARSIQDNMLDVHPPFQIDGNFGIAEAILEALLQSHAGYIDVLPALPPEWKDGAVRGMKLRGGLTADMSWKDGRVTELTVTAVKDCEAEFVYGQDRRKAALTAGERYRVL